MKQRILFVTAEYDSLVKVGGLADVSISLPAALAELGHDVRVLLPRYGCLHQIDDKDLTLVTKLHGRQHHIYEYQQHNGIRLWLYDSSSFRQRQHHPYVKANGQGWDNDASAFAEFSKTAALLAGDCFGIGWQADIVHANEWHTGLVPVYQFLHRIPAASVFTIHNLAYQGLFPAETLQILGLPTWLYHPQALEFYGQLSFMKGGLIFADQLTTVSPSYAKEILTAEFGERLDGVLRNRSESLSGILNGIDMQAWNPENDPALTSHFSPQEPQNKGKAKLELINQFGLNPTDDDEPLLVFVGRFTAQKGINLLLGILPTLMKMPVRLGILGTGDRLMEAALREAARQYKGKLAVEIRYSETFARRCYAGADIFLMPSHFEPCGLSQMYAMRYGAVPVAHAVGGLCDTIKDGVNGFLFDHTTVDSFIASLATALQRYKNKKTWNQMVRVGMKKNYGWQTRASHYLRIYTAAQKTRINTITP